ncbi:MAG: biotin/lipoyl-containing protein, partial [Ktedonobacterales bacterium]
IQRRHQKVLEESPCVALTPELRTVMGDAAVRAAAAVGYVNAGTCEFLLDADGRYYFLEMNTRLQVEHPITEAVMGYDLVRRQLAIAAGQPLDIAQGTVAPRGHAIEVRLYAEDPANGYLPSSGRILAFAPPHAPGVRVDAGVATGDEVSVNYDPMLAKLIVAAEDRPAAIQRLRWALDHCATLGVITNTPLLRAIADDADFQAGRTNTAFLETHDLSDASQPPTLDPLTLAAAALWETLAASSPSSPSSPVSRATRGPFNPWTRGVALAGASSGGARRFRYAAPDGRSHLVTLRAVEAPDTYMATLDGEAYPADGQTLMATLGQDGALALAVGAAREVVYVVRRGYELLVWAHGHSYTLAKPRPLEVETAAHSGEIVTGAQTLTAPMAGTIIKVNVAIGDTVEARETLVVLGAMKMEHAITAPQAGRVTHVAHAAGDVVPGGATLVELAPLDGAGDAR